MPPDDESLESLYTRYYTALHAVAQITWITAYPPLLPSEESEAMRQARDLANEYEMKIRLRLQRTKDSVSPPVGAPR